MADYYGVNATKVLTPTSDNILSPGTLGGRVRVLTDSITVAAAGDETIAIGRELQAGAIIVGIQIKNAALGANITLEVGDSDDPNRYITAYDANANTEATFADNLIGGLHYKIGTNDGDEQILITVRDAAAGGAAGALKINVLYTED
jgi:hypothetical protein